MTSYMRERIAGYISFPFSNYLYNRSGIMRMYREGLRKESISPEIVRAAQLAKIKTVIAYANKWCPYYKRLFKRIGLLPDDIHSFGDLNAIPPLTRDILNEQRYELLDSRMRNAALAADKANQPPGAPLAFARFRQNNLVRNTSSGSTGAPTVFYENGSVSAANWAAEMRLRTWFGIGPGASEARMARVSADYLRSSKTVGIRKLVWNQLLLPGISLDSKQYALCCKELERFRPRVLWGFTSALSGLAEFIRDKRDSRTAFQPELVITWAAPLYEHEKEVLAQIFKCPVTNIYGAREVGHIAARCPAGSLHAFEESVYLESHLASNTQESELLATTLTPTPMPFIRYSMGDLGNIAHTQCACGKSLRIIGKFLGRTGEIFYTENGSMVSPNFWCRLFMAPHMASSVKRFQIVYKSPNKFEIRLVKGFNFADASEAYITQTIREKLDKAISVSFSYVDEIKPTVSGKYQMVVNECTSQGSRKHTPSKSYIPGART